MGHTQGISKQFRNVGPDTKRKRKEPNKSKGEKKVGQKRKGEKENTAGPRELSCLYQKDFN